MRDLSYIYSELEYMFRYKRPKSEITEMINQKIKKIQNSTKEIESGDDVISELIHRNYLIEEWKYDEICLRLTEEGKQSILDYYTDDNSQEFQIYANEINKNLNDNKELHLSVNTIAEYFHKKISVQHVIDELIKPTEETKTNFLLAKATQEYHNLQLQKQGHTMNEDLFIFHFIPTIFVASLYRIKEPITLKIEGIDSPKGLYLSKPYRNSKYTVAGCKYKGHKPSIGFYPIVVPKKDAPKSIDIILHWNVDSLKITHKIQFIFNQNDNVMSFFSSDQTLSSSLTILEDKDAYTITDINNEAWDDRSVIITQSDHFNLYINEIVHLDNFPCKHDQSIHADKRFESFFNAFYESEIRNH